MFDNSAVWNDIRYAFRMMQRTPLFTAAVVSTVAIAIAANATIFTVVNAVLIRSLPFSQPERIVQVAEKNDKLNLPVFAASVLNFLSWREQQQSFEQLAGVGSATFTLTGNGEPEQVTGNRISPVLDQVLGTRPLLGRAFSVDEEKPGSAAVAMISEGLWKRRFASDRNLVGRAILLDGAPTTVVGIEPESMKLITGGDIYEPLTIDPSKELRLNHVIVVFGRLKPGVSPSRAQAEMDTISLRVGQQYPEVKNWGIHLVSLLDTFVTPELKTGLLVLLVAVAFVLLIACANIAEPAARASRYSTKRNGRAHGTGRNPYSPDSAVAGGERGALGSRRRCGASRRLGRSPCVDPFFTSGYAAHFRCRHRCQRPVVLLRVDRSHGCIVRSRAGLASCVGQDQ